MRTLRPDQKISVRRSALCSARAMLPHPCSTMRTCTGPLHHYDPMSPRMPSPVSEQIVGAPGQLQVLDLFISWDSDGRARSRKGFIAPWASQPAVRRTKQEA